VDLLVPPIYAVMRNASVPTTLRTSSISLLADCVDKSPLAMLPYVQDLSLGLIDLLQVETVPEKPTIKLSKEEESQEEEEATPVDPSMDSEPTARNSKFPPLRRAALHFLSLLIRASTKLAYDDNSSTTADIFPRSTFQRADITLRYIASTDEDNVVRVMAREARENLEQLQQALIGL